MREWLTRLMDWVRRGRLERELAEELRFHRERLERDALAGAASPDDARAAARRRLGSPMRITEAARDRWSIPSLEALAQDVRYAGRGLRRTPIFTATVVLTLALGIGANVATFGVVDRLMFRPIGLLRDPETVHRVYLQWNQGDGRPLTQTGVSYRRYLELRRTPSFSEVAGLMAWPIAVGQGEAARERDVYGVTSSYFGFFDARPALGRFFATDEEAPPLGADVAVLSHAFWKSELGGRRDVLGQVLHVGDVKLTVIGVAPEGLSGIDEVSPPVMFVPFPTLARSIGFPSDRMMDFFGVLVRRKPTISLEAASADVARMHRMSWTAEREEGAGRRMGSPALELPVDKANPRGMIAAVRRAAGPDPMLETRIAKWLSGVALVVLLIACANVANLFVARAVQRQRETVVRIALGVSRRRMLAHALAESLLVTLAGAAVGLLLAQWGGAAIRSLLLTTMHGTPTAQSAMATFTDGRTVAVAAGLAVTIGTLVGLAAALLAERGDLARILRAGARGGTAQRMQLRAALLVAQGALSVALLVGASLFVRSLEKVKALPMGYDASRVLVAAPVYRTVSLEPPALVALHGRMLTAAQAIPGVEAASLSLTAPLRGTARMPLFVAGIDSVGALGRFAYNVVTPDYFSVMGIRITRGRGFTTEDRADGRLVTVVSESMARVIWPGKEPLGQCIRVAADTTPCRTVVGIAADIMNSNFQMVPVQPHFYYLPRGQFAMSQEIVLLRTRGEPSADAERVRQAVQEVMPGASYVTVRPLQELVDNVRRPWQLGATAFLFLGVLAFIVAAVGLNGVIGYAVAQRTHELGVRIALGARRADLLWLVVGQSLRLTLVGVGIGGLLALSGSRWLEPLLFRQSAKDPLVYGVVALAMIVVAIAASASPAARAVRADPNLALRAD